MSDLRWLQLTADELDAFLGDGGTGVLSFSTAIEDPPYTVPVSYGYSGDTGHLHFRLALPEGSTKGELLDRPVSFVTHGHTDEGWRSVVATGDLEDVSELPPESAAIQERWAIAIPLVDVFEVPPDEVSFHPFRLVPDRMTGRKAVGRGE